MTNYEEYTKLYINHDENKEGEKILGKLHLYKNLETLTFDSTCFLSDDEMKELSYTLSKLENLKSLTFTDTLISLELIDFSQLKKLEELVLDDMHNLSEYMITKLNYELPKLENLRILCLPNGKPDQIDFSQLKKLEELILDELLFETEDSKKLINQLSRLKNLRILNLSSGITGGEVSLFDFSKFKKLEELVLYGMTINIQRRGGY
jgi:hypothetical protein